MFMVKLSHTALNFGYDFVLIVDFFGTPGIGLFILFRCLGESELEFA